MYQILFVTYFKIYLVITAAYNTKATVKLANFFKRISRIIRNNGLITTDTFVYYKIRIINFYSELSKSVDTGR